VTLNECLSDFGLRGLATHVVCASSCTDIDPPYRQFYLQSIGRTHSFDYECITLTGDPLTTIVSSVMHRYIYHTYVHVCCVQHSINMNILPIWIDFDGDRHQNVRLCGIYHHIHVSEDDQDRKSPSLLSWQNMVLNLLSSSNFYSSTCECKCMNLTDVGHLSDRRVVYGDGSCFTVNDVVTFDTLKIDGCYPHYGIIKSIVQISHDRHRRFLRVSHTRLRDKQQMIENKEKTSLMQLFRVSHVDQ